jgi:general secretion pathway protein G
MRKALMLTALIMGILGVIFYAQQRDMKLRHAAVNSNLHLKLFESALSLFYLDNEFYPSTEQGLGALVEKPGTEPIPATYVEGGYMKLLPADPFGTPYQYHSNGQKASVHYFGPNQENDNCSEDDTCIEVVP